MEFFPHDKILIQMYVVARNPTALMQETSVTELHSPHCDWKKMADISHSTAHLYESFLRSIFVISSMFYWSLKGVIKKKDCGCLGKCWGDLGSNIHKHII